MNVIPTIANEFFASEWVGARFFFAPKPGIAGFRAGGFGASVFIFKLKRNSAE